MRSNSFFSPVAMFTSTNLLRGVAAFGASAAAFAPPRPPRPARPAGAPAGRDGATMKPSHFESPEMVKVPPPAPPTGNRVSFDASLTLLRTSVASPSLGARRYANHFPSFDNE